MALARTLIVANPYEANRLRRELERSSLPVDRPVPTTDATDEALAELGAAPVALAIVAENLAAADAHELVMLLLRAALPPKILWLGDADEATSSTPPGVQRLSRPFGEAAFLSAVRDALTAAGFAAPLVGGQAPRPAASTAAGSPGLAAAASLMIDAFVSEQLARSVTGLPATAAPEDFGDLMAEALGDGDGEGAALDESEHEREPTLILPGGSGARGGGPESPLPLSTPSGWGMASELKRKMAAMEQRLFGAASAPGADDEAAEREIDLDQIHAPPTSSLFEELRESPASLAPTALVAHAELGNVEVDVATEVRAAAKATPEAVELGTGAGDIAAQFGRLARESFTGAMTCQRGERVVTVHFEAGCPVFATSTSPHDRMGEMLYREGKITRAHYEASRHIVADTGRRLGEILVELGYLKRRELLPAVRRHLEDLVYALFGWEQGQVSFGAGPPPDEKIRLSAHPAALLFEGVRRKYTVPRLEAQLGGRDVVVLPPTREVLVATLAEAGATPGERACAEALDGSRSLAELAPTVPGGITTCLAVAHALCALGVCRTRDREVLGAAARADGQATGTGVAGAVGADVQLDRERVLARHALIQDGDYFMVLGLRRDATAFEIRRAWEAARRDFAPASFPVEIQQTMGGVLRDILDVVDEAYQVLRGDGLRERYLSQLLD